MPAAKKSKTAATAADNGSAGVDMGKINAQPTEEKPFAQAPAFGTESPAPEPAPAETPAPPMYTNAPELEQEEEEEEEPPGDDDDDDDDDGPALTSKQLAKFYVAFADSTQTHVFRALLKKKAFPNKKDWKRAKDIERQKRDRKQQVVELSADDLALDARLAELKEKMDSIPFTADERKVLETPLAECLRKWGDKLPPEALLCMAIAQVFGSRLATVYMD